MLRQTQGQRLQQKADPQLLLTNRVLQMSSMELQQRVVQEMAENPALELSEEYPCNRCDIPGPQCVDCPYYHAQFGNQSSNDRDDFRTMSYDLLAGKDDEVDPIALLEDKPTLQDHLLMQLRSTLNTVDFRIGEYLISNIDADGYLQCTASEAAADLEATEQEVERTLQVIQTMDPSGVGARALQECLLIQAQLLAAEGKLPPFVMAILRNYWKELCANKIRTIARGMRATAEEAQTAVTFIRQNLSPYPGSSFRPPWDKHSHRSSQSVRPDVVIHLNEENEFEIQVVEGDHQQIHLNPKYARMWSEMRERPHEYPEAERRHVQDYVNRAQMFLKSLDDRKQILYQVAECVLEEQHRFFETEREEDLNALTQTKVASLLRVHESTVSRTVAEKFMQLPSGQVVNLSFFFDRSKNLRALVQNVLATENPQSPYSDQEISDILRGQGIVIARRTVMKYREEMNILSSRQRART